MNLVKGHTRYDTRKPFFSERMVWNSLPCNVVSASTGNEFKSIYIYINTYLNLTYFPTIQHVGLIPTSYLLTSSTGERQQQPYCTLHKRTVSSSTLGLELPPRYFTWLLNSNSFLQKIIGRTSSGLYFLTNRIISVFSRFTESPLALHQRSTPRKMRCVMSHTVGKNLPTVSRTPSSANPCANYLVC